MLMQKNASFYNCSTIIYVSATWSFYLTMYLRDYSTSKPVNLPVLFLIAGYYHGILWKYTLI